jgi:hypothetical protein
MKIMRDYTRWRTSYPVGIHFQYFKSDAKGGDGIFFPMRDESANNDKDFMEVFVSSSHELRETIFENDISKFCTEFQKLFPRENRNLLEKHLC